MNKIETILRELGSGPKTARELGEALDEITPYVARTVSKLIHRGLVTNLNAGRARALYALPPSDGADQ